MLRLIRTCTRILCHPRLVPAVEGTPSRSIAAVVCHNATNNYPFNLYASSINARSVLIKASWVFFATTVESEAESPACSAISAISGVNSHRLLPLSDRALRSPLPH